MLVDSERISVRIDAFVLSELGWPMSEAEVVERFVGRSFESMKQEIETHLGRRLLDDWEASYERLYREAFEAELEPVDGVPEALDLIPIPTCVASSSTHEAVRHTLELTNLHARFRGRVFSATEVKNGKPAPDLFLHAADRMGVEPAACAVVEDSLYGVEAARAAGMSVFGYAGGVTSGWKLEGPNTLVFDDMRRLPRLLGQE